MLRNYKNGGNIITKWYFHKINSDEREEKSTACGLQKFGKQVPHSDGEVRFQVFEEGSAKANITKKPAE